MEILPCALPPPGSRCSYGEEWGTILDRIRAPDAPYWVLRGNGALHTTLPDMQGSAALGTLPRQEDTVQTIVRLDFERGSVYKVYVWGPVRPLGIRAMPQLPALRFVPVSDCEFVASSLDGPVGDGRLRFEDREGAPVMVVSAGGREILARR